MAATLCLVMAVGTAMICTAQQGGWESACFMNFPSGGGLPDGCLNPGAICYYEVINNCAPNQWPDGCPPPIIITYTCYNMVLAGGGEYFCTICLCQY
jgi:hypothetical protein